MGVEKEVAGLQGPYAKVTVKSVIQQITWLKEGQ
jgi:hypothetical protein